MNPHSRNSQYRWMTALACVVLLATAAISLQAHSPEDPKPTRVAIVNIEMVLKKMDEKRAMDADMNRLKEDIDREDVNRKNRIKQMTADMEILQPGQPGRAEAEERLFEETAYYQAWRQLQERRLEKTGLIRLQALYNSITQAVEREARSAGFDLVLHDDRNLAPYGRTQMQVLENIKGRKVLYAGDEVDLTDHVIQVLNNEFNNQ